MNQNASLRINLRGLAEVVDAIEELDAGRKRGGRARELFFEREPHRHGVEAYGLPRQARHEQLGAVCFLDERAKSVRDLEPPFVIDFGSVIAPEHVRLLHFAPQKTTARLGVGSCSVNRKM